MPGSWPMLFTSSGDDLIQESSRRFAIEQLPRMAGHHQILVSRYDPRRNARSGRRDARAACGICLRVERHPDPLCVIAYACPYLGGVLADAAGEDDSVETVKCGRKRTDLPSDPVNEQIDRVLCRRKIARQQSAHVARKTGNAE